MAKKNEIVHAGKIVHIDPDFTTVEIMVSSACSECHAKGLCGMSEGQEKVIMGPTDPYTGRAVGGEAVLMILILSLSFVISNEFLRGGVALAGVGAYYFIIWLLRDKLSDQFEFYIN